MRLPSASFRCPRRVIAGLLAAIASAGADPTPGPAVTDIFPPRAKHVHSSSIIELPSGDLLACWYHGSGERRANDVVVEGALLRTGGHAWGPVFTLADTPGLPDCNPVLFVDPRERLWLFWVIPVGNRWENSVLKYRRADRCDEEGRPVWAWQDSIHLVPGERFSEALAEGFESLDPQEDLWAEYALPYTRQLKRAAAEPALRQKGWMPRNHPLALPGGRLLLPLYSDGFNVSLMALSDDGGATWRASEPVVGLGPIQPTVARRTDGTLVAWFRDSGGPPSRVLTSLSRDEGATWSPARDTDLPNPGSSLEVIALADGRWVMVGNDTESGRHRLVLLASRDEGRSWPHRRVLEEAKAGTAGFSYPSLLETRDGTIHVTYSADRPAGESIRHARCSIEWLTAPAGPSTDR